MKEIKLEEIKVPRVMASSADCPCPLCRCAGFSPIGVEGEKDVVCQPVVNPTGDKMKCEVQPKVVEHGQKVCSISLQITGPGIKHGCSQAEVRKARLGQLPWGYSCHRCVTVRRKRNISMMERKEA